MNYTDISKIKSLVTLATSRKSSHVLEGDYLSPFNGPSLEFDKLDEYRSGDSIRYIDWKASSAHGKMLVRRFISQRRHKALLIGDCGIKMSGHTSKNEVKSKLAETILGSFSWLFSAKGCDYSLLCSYNGKIGRESFHCGNEHLVGLLNRYSKNAEDRKALPLNFLLEYAAKSYSGEMIILLVTDLEGLSRLDKSIVQKLTYKNDLMVACIDDILLSSPGSYDVYGDRYSDTFIIGGKKLYQAEIEMREKIYNEKHDLLTKNRASVCMISEEKDIPDCILSLFEQNTKLTHDARK